MKLEKTVDGLFAAPVTAPTTAAAPRMRELAADVMANTPELAQFLDFGPNAATPPSVGSSAAAAAVGPQPGWQYRVHLGALNAWTTGSSTK
jgi:hypothetical protein